MAEGFKAWVACWWAFLHYIGTAIRTNLLPCFVATRMVECIVSSFPCCIGCRFKKALPSLLPPQMGMTLAGQVMWRTSCHFPHNLNHPISCITNASESLLKPPASWMWATDSATSYWRSVLSRMECNSSLHNSGSVCVKDCALECFLKLAIVDSVQKLKMEMQMKNNKTPRRWCVELMEVRG